MIPIDAASETALRLGCFVGLFVLLAALETAWPRRSRSLARAARWPANLGMSLASQLVVRLLVPLTAAALAIEAASRGWGLLNRVDLPAWLEIALAVLVLDFAIYWQHRLFHVVPALWRLHRMHHADVDLDVTTGVRFHPASILVSAAIKLAVVLLLGPAAVAVLLFEVLLNATSLFNHANLALPARLDRVLRLLVVTPDMHRVHHSLDDAERNCNFGFNFPWWDRLLGTYRAQPARGHDAMTLGLPAFRDAPEQRFFRLLGQPLRGEPPSPAPPAGDERQRS